MFHILILWSTRPLLAVGQSQGPSATTRADGIHRAPHRPVRWLAVFAVPAPVNKPLFRMTVR